MVFKSNLTPACKVTNVLVSLFSPKWLRVAKLKAPSEASRRNSLKPIKDPPVANTKCLYSGF